MRNRSGAHGFTTVELLVVVAIIFLLLSVFWPAHGCSAKTPAMQILNSTYLRGINQSLIMTGDDNNDWMLGFSESGELIDGSVEYRYAHLLEGDMLPGSYLINPHEDTKQVWESGPVTSDHYSYAMLDIDEPGARSRAWNLGNHHEPGVVDVTLSDRNTGVDTSAGISSLFTEASGRWKGGIAYIDGHVEYRSEAILDTTFDQDGNRLGDHLFEAEGPDDAMMIYEGD